MGFPKLSKVSEDTEMASSLELVDESVEEYCNSKFYLPSIDFNSNLLQDDPLAVQRSNSEVIAFLRTGDRIYCKECDFILTGGVGGPAGMPSSSTAITTSAITSAASTSAAREKSKCTNGKVNRADSPNPQSTISSSNSSHSNCLTVHSSTSHQLTSNSLTKLSQSKPAKDASRRCSASSRKDAPPPDDRSICLLHNPPVAYVPPDLDEKGNLQNLQKSEKQMLEESIMRLFIDGKIATGGILTIDGKIVAGEKLKDGEKLVPGELTTMHTLIGIIHKSTAGPFLFDYYSRIMVNKGLHQLKLKLLNKQLGEDLPSGEQLFKRLAEVWEEFFNQILPIIECAFYRLRDNRHLTIKQTSLIRFRDELVLKLDSHLKDEIKDRLRTKKPIPNAIRQMLLVLNNILDTFPPNGDKIRLELLCVLVVDPFIGWRGLYRNNDTDEPAIRSNELEIYANKPPFECGHRRKPSRPLSVQPEQMDSLTELVQNAAKKQNHRSLHFG